ncbi:MAG: radical SAM protein [Candidatus Dormibacteraeota bacterium]|nr:radical SAM protein [Candidatus Dormibacteraeota bacterium]
MTVRLPARDEAEVELARTWCALTGNTLVGSNGGLIEVRRGRPAAAAQLLPPSRRPGVRLWMYTNFDCNLACAYCCVRSSPRAPRRALGHERIAQLAAEAAEWGVAELYLTGGEPFILPDIGQSICACVRHRPTTVLTNGMLFKGRRLDTLAALPREDLALQISLDSATADRHDRNRGEGSWSRAMDGIATAVRLGFRVRVAATIEQNDPEALREADRLSDLLDELGIAEEDQLTRPVALRGFADSGLVLEQATMVPEVTVTATGVYWHPVGADDVDMLIDTEVFPLAARIDRVVELFEEYAQRQASAAMVFPCA